MKHNVLNSRNVLKESVLATLIILFVTYLLSFIAFSMEYGKAFHQGLSDFDIYDLAYSGKEKYKNDSNIILVELGNTRSEIASQINLISQYNPKVIGLDVRLETANRNEDDSLGDINLQAALKNKSNIVYSYQFENGTVLRPNVFNGIQNKNNGYINFDGEIYSVIRSYSPFRTLNNKKYQAFTTCVVQMFDADKYEIFKKKNREEQIIDYAGNVENYTALSRGKLQEYAGTNQLTRIIDNKIVLIGFFVLQNELGQPPLVMDDLHFSPVNEIVTGKSFPDMYGVVIHANIISMILRSKFPVLAPLIVSYLFAFLFVFLFNYVIILQFHKKRHPHHGLFLLLQLLYIIIITYLFLGLYDIFRYKVRLEPILIALVLSLEMLGLYKSIAVWLHKKFNYTTIFIHKRII